MENKNTEVIKINPTEFGLTEETATNITRGLDQILKEIVVLIQQYSEIITLDIDEPSTAKRAAELRKLIKNNRTQGIVKWHETNKEFYLRGGQFVDAIKKRELEVNNRMEEALEQIEKRQEILERERIANLQSLRVSLISEYVENAERMDLRNMQLDVYEAFYAAKKKEFEEKKEAERLAYIEFEREKKEKGLHDSRREQALPYYQFWSDFEKSLHFGKQSEGDFTAFINRIEAAKLAKAPIKKKLSVWVDSFEINRTFIDGENETAKEIIAKFEAFKNWAKTQVENI